MCLPANVPPAAAHRTPVRPGRTLTMTAIPRLDPDAAARVASFGVIPPMREARAGRGARQAIETAPLPDAMPPMAAIEDRAAPGPAGPIPLRIYRPTTPGLIARAGLLPRRRNGYGLQPLLRAARHGRSPRRAMPPWWPSSYRLAPEHPAPAQFDDAYAATTWVADNADRLERRPGATGRRRRQCRRFARRSRRAGRPRPRWTRACCQVLLYPGLDRDMGAPSIIALPDAPMLSLDDICLHARTRRHRRGRPHDPYRVPAYARDLGGLPQAIVVTAECDPIS